MTSGSGSTWEVFQRSGSNVMYSHCYPWNLSHLLLTGLLALPLLARLSFIGNQYNHVTPGLLYTRAIVHQGFLLHSQAGWW